MASAYHVELLDGELRSQHSPSILVAADVLATDQWQKLVNLTQADLLERGLVVGRHSSTHQLVSSKTIKGYGQAQTNSYDRATEAALAVPILPFGIRSISPRIKASVAIHTHPMPPEVDHIQTSIISDKDIATFSRSRYKAMVMLDRGGAHLVARTCSGELYGSMPAPDLVSTTMREVIAESGISMDVMARLARRLGQYGLAYFYTPELRQNGETVELQNLNAV